MMGMLGWIAARIFNVHLVTDGIYRSAQSYGAGVGLLIRHLRLNSLINLRGENPNAAWYRTELAACAAAGVQHLDVRFSSKRLPAAETLRDLIRLYDTAPRPALMKCSGGADRTSLAAGLFLLLEGRPLEEARAQTAFFPYLHRPRREQQWIRGLFDFIAAENAAPRLRAWIETDYNAERFAAFLTARGQGDTWRA